MVKFLFFSRLLTPTEALPTNNLTQFSSYDDQLNNLNNSIENELNVVDVQSTSTPSTTQSQTQPSRDDHNFISPV